MPLSLPSHLRQQQDREMDRRTSDGSGNSRNSRLRRGDRCHHRDIATGRGGKLARSPRAFQETSIQEHLGTLVKEIGLEPE
jgi:hypothetical protein